MDKQKVYNTIKKHLLTQKKKSQAEHKNQGTICMYHSPDGSKCAIGCLVPDSKYTRNIEGFSAGELRVKKSLYSWARPKTENELRFLYNLQTIHDLLDVDDWKKELKKFAKNNNLKG